MLQSSAFDYINVLDKAADASWLRESVLANNIANATTPDIKRYDVNFQSLLEREMMDSKFNRNLDEKVHNVNLRRLTATSQIDLAAESFSYRLDGNNVDIDTEGVKLAANQIKYNGLFDSINQEFANLKLVMRS